MEPEFTPIDAPVDDKTLEEIFNKIEKAKPLLEQGLLREVELQALEEEASRAYENTADHNSIQYRKYDRRTNASPMYRAVSQDGYVGVREASALFDIQQQISELLSLHSVDVQPTEIFVAPNTPYTARFYLRNILSQATSLIEIKDDYLFSVNATTKNIDLLWIIQPYAASSLGVSVKLLGASNNPHNSIASDIKAFLRQNSSVEIKGNNQSGSRETHDRFIIIDGTKVYKIGTSIKDLGAAQSSIDEVNDTAVSDKYIQQFQTWWSNAHDYSNLI